MSLSNILESKWIRGIAFLVGLIAGIAKVADSIIPTAVQPIVTVCLVITAIYLVAVIAQLFIERTITEQIEKKNNKQVSYDKHTFVENAEHTYQYISERYGIGYLSLDVQWNIKEDGSALLQRTIDTKAYSTVERLDTYLLVPEGDPVGNERHISHDIIESLDPDPDRNITLIDIKRELNKLSALIAISPPLNPGDTTKFRMKERLSTGLYAVNLSPSEVSQREKPYDYSGWTINRPTKKLSLQVFFPEGMKPKVYGAEVRYASASGFPSEQLQYEEQKRLNKARLLGPEGGRYVLTLDVDYPMIGLIYILRWHPIMKNETLNENL